VSHTRPIAYRILKKLGGDGMGVVHKAEDTRLHRLESRTFIVMEFLDGQTLKDFIIARQGGNRQCTERAGIAGKGSGGRSAGYRIWAEIECRRSNRRALVGRRNFPQ
jgi:hypothetical protein